MLLSSQDFQTSCLAKTCLWPWLTESREKSNAHPITLPFSGLLALVETEAQDPRRSLEPSHQFLFWRLWNCFRGLTLLIPTVSYLGFWAPTSKDWQHRLLLWVSHLSPQPSATQLHQTPTEFRYLTPVFQDGQVPLERVTKINLRQQNADRSLWGHFEVQQI